MRFRHPSKDRLRDWLSGADDDPELEAHIDGCERCSSVIEALGDDVLDEPLGLALAQILAPPSDLSDRLQRRVNDRLSGREAVGLLAELFGAGLETGRLLIVEPTPPVVVSEK